MHHHETVFCPKCSSIELIKVLHTFPLWTYSGTCSKCSTIITKETWNSNGHIWNDDMMNVMLKIKSNSIDVVITDPPYGVRKSTGDDESKENWDDKTYFTNNVSKWLSECLRVTKHTVVWFCAGRMIPYIMKEIQPDMFHRMHIWNKPAGTQFAGASHNNIWYSMEPILVFTKDKQKTVSYGKEERYNYDALEYSTVARKKYNHSTSKPVELIATLVQHYSNEGELVLDPFGGSGSLAEACIKTKRRYVTIEKDVDHYNTIIKRISDINAQTDLFL